MAESGCVVVMMTVLLMSGRWLCGDGDDCVADVW